MHAPSHTSLLGTIGLRSFGRQLLLFLNVAAHMHVACAATAFSKQDIVGGPTVREVVEFTRIVQPATGDRDQLAAQVSPDGRRAFIVTRRAEVSTDRNLFDILLLDVDPVRLAGQRQQAPRRLLRVEARQDYSYAIPSVRDARWAGNRAIVFLGRIDDARFQVYRLDALSGRLTALTAAQSDILAFDVSADLRRVGYVAQVPNPPMPPGARSIVVGNQSFWSVEFGQTDLRPQYRKHQYFVAAVGSDLPDRPLGLPFAGVVSPPSVSVSPDGRWMVAPRFEPERQLRWARDYPIVSDFSARFARGFTLDPQNYFSRPVGYIARRMVAYRLSDASEHPTLDAPDDALSGSEARPDRLWIGRGESVILAGTHLPLIEGQEVDRASHIVEFWPDSGRWAVVAKLDKPLTAVHRLRTAREGFVALDGATRRVFVRAAAGGWQEREAGTGAADVDESMLGSGWDLTIEEGMNRPADVVARNTLGRSVELTRLNPQFAVETWGVMQRYGWKDLKGRQWDGGLMRPAGADPAVRLPLVIQTYGFYPERFYLDGPQFGFTSGFAGRAFLRENMLVLAVPWRASTDAPTDERNGTLGFIEGVQGAIESLVRGGLVDPQRIGILGWSATGERVLNLVTFSDAPIRSASLLDGDANTLFSFTVTYGANAGFVARKEVMNEGRAYGDTLGRWVRNDPAMHTDCVKAAMRIETYGRTVLNNWDIYALLRRQYKAAEMIVMPQGAHSLSRPSERMISLQGNVDWHRFWLKDEQRSELVLPGETAESLQAQYRQWRRMADLKRVDDAKPGCVRGEGGR